MNQTKEKIVNVHEGHRQRMREKFDKDMSMSTFQDHEMLEFILSLVIPRKDTNVIAHDLLNKIGPLDCILSSQPNELFKIKNMTTSASYLLASFIPLMRRALMKEVKKEDFTSPADTIEYLHKFFFKRKNECFALALLDINFQLKKEFYYEGKTDNVMVEASDIVLKATKEYAKYVIIAHNHPSGNVTPSIQDIEMTKQLFSALGVVNIQLIDHIIFNDEGYFSFHNNGIMKTIEMDAHEKFFKNLCDQPYYKRCFLANLEEFVIDPEVLSEEKSLSAINKTELTNRQSNMFENLTKK